MASSPPGPAPRPGVGPRPDLPQGASAGESGRSGSSRVTRTNPSVTIHRGQSGNLPRRSLGERNIQQSATEGSLLGGANSSSNPLHGATPRPLPDDFSMTLPNGAEVFLERSDDGKGPTDLDPRVADILKKEHNGDIEGAKKSWLSKVAKATSTAMQFVKNNKDFQATVGFLGILTCVGIGCAFPVALVAAGPFIIMFANGFIDNPMLIDEPSSQKPPPGSGNPANNPGPAESEGANPKPPKPSGSDDGSDPKPPPSPPAPPPPPRPGGSDPSDQSGPDDEGRGDLERRVNEHVRRTADEGHSARHKIVDNRAGEAELQQRAAEFVEEEQGLTELRNNTLSFNVHDYLFGVDGLKPGLVHGVSSHQPDAVLQTLTPAQAAHVESQVAFLVADYQSEQEGGKSKNISQREWRMVKNAVTRAAVDILANNERQNARPGENGVAPQIHKGELYKQVTMALGLNRTGETGAPINSYIESKSYDIVKSWHQRNHRAITGDNP